MTRRQLNSMIEREDDEHKYSYKDLEKIKDLTFSMSKKKEIRFNELLFCNHSMHDSLVYFMV